jgi:hypothetical protein
MIFVLGQDTPQMRLVPHQASVEDFPAEGADPPLHDRIRAKRPHRTLDDLDTDTLEHSVDGGHEFAVLACKQQQAAGQRARHPARTSPR